MRLLRNLNSLFMDFSDYKLNGVSCISLRRFVMFYYAPTALFKEVLGKKYPHTD